MDICERTKTLICEIIHLIDVFCFDKRSLHFLSQILIIILSKRKRQVKGKVAAAVSNLAR